MQAARLVVGAFPELPDGGDNEPGDFLGGDGGVPGSGDVGDFQDACPLLGPAGALVTAVDLACVAGLQQCLPSDAVHGHRGDVAAEPAAPRVANDVGVEGGVDDLDPRGAVHQGAGEQHEGGGLPGAGQRLHRDVLAVEEGIEDRLLLRRRRELLHGWRGRLAVQPGQHVPDGRDRLQWPGAAPGVFPQLPLLAPGEVGSQRFPQFGRVVVAGARYGGRAGFGADADAPGVASGLVRLGRSGRFGRAGRGWGGRRCRIGGIRCRLACRG